MNYYSVLGVSKLATAGQIKDAFKAKALETHPDKARYNKLSQEQASKAFQAIKEAYDTLKDPNLKRAYDTKLASAKAFPFEYRNFASAPPSPKRACVESIFPKDLDKALLSIIDRDAVAELEKYLSKVHVDMAFRGTMLYQACRRGASNVLKYLILKKHVSPHTTIDNSIYFSGPVFKAAAKGGHLDIVKYLLEMHHVDIEAQGLHLGTKGSALSEAAKEGHEHVVEYLLAHGANPNPQVGHSDIVSDTIRSGTLNVLKRLVRAGSIVDRFHLERALERGDLLIVQFILELKPGLYNNHPSHDTHACSAIRSGNLQLLQYLLQNEALDLFEKQWTHETLDEVIIKLMKALGDSGSIEIARYLLQEVKILEKCQDLNKQKKAVIATSAGTGSWDNRKVSPLERVQLLSFLIEEMGLLPEREQLEKIIREAGSAHIQSNAYLQSYLLEQGPVKDLLLLVAMKGLDGLSIKELFWLYTKKVIKKGKNQTFCESIHLHISDRKLSQDELRALAVMDPVFRQQAFFYYLDYYHNKDLTMLRFFVEELGADIHDLETYNGESPLLYAWHSGRYNKIVKYLIDRGVDVYRKDSNGYSVDDLLKNNREYAAQVEKRKMK